MSGFGTDFDKFIKAEWKKEIDKHIAELRARGELKSKEEEEEARRSFEKSLDRNKVIKKVKEECRKFEKEMKKIGVKIT
ncbi:MAG: hypothetical protein OXU40_03845 [Nitrospira sp.]|nr:hypothetical protein [Nitrospira sp.]